MNSQQIKLGVDVVLLTKPDGCMSRHYPLTAGKTYRVLDLNGSNVVTTTDVPGETANYWRGRVKPAGVKQ